MSVNEETIHRFYTAFQNLDYKTMQSCYHPDAVFNDPAFGLLDANSVGRSKTTVSGVRPFWKAVK